jgi:hypothetical protein
VRLIGESVRKTWPRWPGVPIAKVVTKLEAKKAFRTGENSPDNGLGAGHRQPTGGAD